MKNVFRNVIPININQEIKFTLFILNFLFFLYLNKQEIFVRL